MEATSPILHVSGLRKSFVAGGQEIAVLQGLDLSVMAGELVGICGASGSGKSTFLNLLAGLESPDAGEVRWGQRVLPTKRLGKLAAARGKFLGMVFQHYYLVPELNALENVALAGRIVGLSGRDCRARALALLDAVELSDRQKSLPAQLSGGERQRVAIARALINRPPVILADEPTGNLDEASADSVFGLFLDLCRQQGVALVLVTHSMVLARRCDRLGRLQAGALVVADPPSVG